MLKKITSLFAAGTMLAVGLSLVGASTASAATVTPAVTVAGAPMYSAGNNLPLASIGITADAQSSGFTVGTPTWSPSDTNVAASTVYTAVVTVTPTAGNQLGNIDIATMVTGAGAGRVSSRSYAINNGILTLTIVFMNSSTGAQQQQQQQTSTATSSNVTDSSITVDWATLAALQSNVSTWRVYVRDRSVSPSVLVGYYDVAGSVHNLTVTGLNAGTQYNFFMADLGGQQMNGYYIGFEPGLNVTTTGSGGGSNNLQAQLAAIAQAAAAKAAAVAKAQSTLVDTFKANKPATISDMSSSDFAVKQQVTVDRINQTVLALQAKNPGVALPLAVIKDVVAKESIVEQISTSVTQGTVQTTQLVKAGLIDSTNSVKSSVMNALKSMDPTSLNTLDKLKTAIAAQTKVAQDRYARTRAIVAKINSGK